MPSLQSFFFKLVSWKWFSRFVTVTICANIVVMSLKHANESSRFVVLEDVGNLVFTVIFAAEAALKLLGLGLRQYFGSSWNVFDFGLAVGGIVSTAFSFGTAGKILRVFRVLRVFRLVEFSRTLQVSMTCVD
jgi:hypothetical protein